MPVFDAALDAKLPLVHVRHEAAAVHMADAWGRITGEPGIALVTGGPGHANAVSALYTALAAESPLILISGHAPLNELGKCAFQEMRQAEVAAPLCKASWTAQSAATLGQDLAKAWRTALSGRPGPVHLSVPNDVLDAVVATDVPGKEAFRPEENPLDEKTREAIVAAIAAATKPVILCGPAMMSAKGRAAMRRLEEASGVPVIGMESPRGVKDPSLGRLAKVLGEADCVVLLGKKRDFTLGFGKPFAQARVLDAPDGVDVLSSIHALVKAIKAKKTGTWSGDVRAALAYRPPEWAALRSKA